MENNKSRLYRILGILALLLSGTMPVQAASVNYYLDQSNDLTDTNFALVTISDSTTDDNIHFNISLLPGAFPSAEGNFGMDKLFFNSLHALDSHNIVDLNLAGWGIETGKSASSFGKFKFQLKGRGHSRTDHLSFNISGIDGDTILGYAIAGDKGYLFAAHVGGFTQTNGTSSTWIANSTLTAVPAPAAAWLFGSGLVALVGLRQHHNNAAL